MIDGLIGNFIFINDTFNVYCEINILDINLFLGRETYTILLFLKAFGVTERKL